MATSLAFNEQFYLQQNPDVVAAIARGQFANAQQHFNQFGAFEGRDPNTFFDTSFYLSQYPDVLNARANPLEHFINFGAAEFRFANETGDNAIDTDGNNFANEFDSAAYLAANPDLANAVGAGRAFENAYEHFVLFGQFESRPGTPAGGPFTNTGTAPGTGNTVALTTDVDTLTGTSGNDTFVGTISATGSTLQSGDTINGGAGNDTLRVVASNNTLPIVGGAQTVVPTLSNVENVEYQGFGNATNTLNLANSTGVQSVSLANGTSSLNVANQSSIVALGATNTTAGTLAMTYTAAAVAGATDVQAINVNNATASFSANGVETFAVNATGTNTIGSLTGAAATGVTVAGAGDLTINTALAAGIETFDASDATGDINVAFADGGDVTVTGGSGDDVFRFGAGFDADDTIDGGEGFDTLQVDGDDFSSTAQARAFNGLTSIERVEFVGNDAAVLNGATFTNAGITNLLFNTAGNDVINNAGSARTYEFGTDNDGTATFTLNAASTTLNVDLLGTNETAASDESVQLDALNVTLSGSQPATALATVNLSSVGNFDADTFNNVDTVSLRSGSTINIDGSADLRIGGSDSNIRIDSSAFTGDLVVRGSIFEGAEGVVAVPEGDDPAVDGVNTVTTQTGSDTFILGEGQETIVFGANGLDSGIIQISTAAGDNSATDAAANGTIFVDTILNFSAGEGGDILAILGGDSDTYSVLTSSAQDAIDELSGAAQTLLNAANEAASAHTTAGWTAFSFLGETYALYEDTASTADFANANTLVRLTGISVDTLTTDNFATLTI